MNKRPRGQIHYAPVFTRAMPWDSVDEGKLEDALLTAPWVESGEHWAEHISKHVFKGRKNKKDVENKLGYNKRINKPGWASLDPKRSGKRQKRDGGIEGVETSQHENVMDSSTMSVEDIADARTRERLRGLLGHGPKPIVYPLKHGTWIVWNRIASCNYEMKAYPKHLLVEVKAVMKPPAVKGDLTGIARPNCPNDFQEMWRYVKSNRPGNETQHWSNELPEGLTTVGRAVAKSKKHVAIHLPKTSHCESKDVLADSDDENSAGASR